MSEHKENVPKLRFPGFTDVWEERRLWEIVEFNPKSILPDEFEYVDLESVVGTNLISHRTESKESAPSRAQRLAQLGDVFYQTVRPYQKNNYLYDLPYDNYVFSTGYAQMRPSIDSYFLLSRVQEELFVKAVLDRSTGTSYPAINSNDLAEIEIKVPIDKDEQVKIGSLFRSLDHLITLHQRKLNNVKNLKDGLLQKMFPKNGEDFPEVRFPGFTGAWEQRHFFGNIKSTIDFRGRTPKKLGLDWSETGYLALSALNVKNGYIDPSADAHYGNQELYDKWMTGRELRKGQVLFTTEAPMGNVAQVPDDTGYILSQRTIAFDVNPEKITDDFLAVLLRSPKTFAELSALSSGGTAKGVSQKSLSQLKVTLPTDLEEQAKIAAFFKGLDHLITLHQRKLEHLQEQKKALLQQMFI
ncbi:restriction endonuclease subunit S [Paenibacillus sp. A3M_27_13]|uniref:restriction endonuclease subunit S n=1 Tax=Paenibacillus sp. A3M_27_13 TaxID=2962029 RepID=UPI000FAF676C|nr:restriction endonuclease subunit S [Paenibacillus sp. A3M_27_13]MCP3747123.1 restriction endonuclease subunit S [Paenibacillus sp. A3M_27_13]